MLFEYSNTIRSLKMGRIEYEYPLFKVYYSNNSNNSNIRGNPVLHCNILCVGAAVPEPEGEGED